ncbi:MAG: ATP-binding protein [Thermodesulfobacteriota bacterium]
MRPQNTLARHPFLSLLAFTGLALAILAGCAISLGDHLTASAAAEGLTARARIAQGPVTTLLKAENHAGVQDFCATVAATTATRVTVILPRGAVLADSHEDPARMENHGDRPEVVAALAGRVEPTRRFSHTLDTEMLYVAVPLHDGETLLGILRTALPTTELESRQAGMRRTILLAALLLFAVAGGVTAFLNRSMNQPLAALRKWAATLADTAPYRRPAVTGPAPVVELAATLDQLAGQLTERISQISQQRNELEALFGSMVEGVLTVDREERIQSFNPAALALLGLDPGRVKGKSTLEAVRNLELQRFISATLSAHETREGEIVLPDPKGRDRSFYLRGVPLKTTGSAESGALIVMSDVTNLRRLETVRRDFVANVSHELKTPITSIAGFVETLLDGAIEEPENARRFLAIIHQQAKRLHAIVEDLLALSRLEQEMERKEVALVRHPLGESLAAAGQTCLPAATAKEITLQQECPAGLAAWLNPPLFEQALVNLIDNAIKYSPAASQVTISATGTAEEVVVAVRDQGVGIAPRDQARVFERFFRVDKARSSTMGGTGLGLAIVKHIVQVHGGRVSLVSTPGKGSTFAIHLRPAPPQNEQTAA